MREKALNFALFWTMMEKFLTVEEAAELLQVNNDTVRRWLRLGELKGRKLGRVWRISPSDLASVGAGKEAEITSKGDGK